MGIQGGGAQPVSAKAKKKAAARARAQLALAAPSVARAEDSSRPRADRRLVSGARAASSLTSSAHASKRPAFISPSPSLGWGYRELAHTRVQRCTSNGSGLVSLPLSLSLRASDWATARPRRFVQRSIVSGAGGAQSTEESTSGGAHRPAARAWFGLASWGARHHDASQPRE